RDAVRLAAGREIVRRRGGPGTRDLPPRGAGRGDVETEALGGTEEPRKHGGRPGAPRGGRPGAPRGADSRPLPPVRGSRELRFDVHLRFEILPGRRLRRT